MAIAHFTIRSRTNVGRQAAQRAVAYLKREMGYAPRQEVGYLRRERGDVRGRDDLVWTATYNLPAWADGDAYTFFEAAATHERVNGRWGIAMEIALPRELSREQQRALADDFVRSQLAGKPALVVMHEPVGSDGPQPHLHVLVSTRTRDGLDRSPAQYFKRANLDHPERGGAAKDPLWDQRQFPLRVRVAYTDLVNAALERAGHEARVDPRSLYTRGIDREAEGKQGWQADGKAVREAIKAQRLGTLTEEHRAAQGYWEARKKVLGADPQDREAMVSRTREWVRNFTPGTQLPPRQAVPPLKESDIQHMQDTLARLRRAALVEQRNATQGRSVSQAEVDRVDDLIREASRYARRGVAPRTHLALRLPEKERAEGYVMIKILEDARDGRDRGR